MKEVDMERDDKKAKADKMDTREKLEADVKRYYTYTSSTLMWPDSANYKTDWIQVPINEVHGWLDRQAAITTHEVIDSYEHKAERQSDRIFELHNKLADALEQVDSLTAERDDLAHELRRARKAAKRWHELASGYRDKAAQFVEIIETLTATLDRKNARIKRLRGKLKRARNK